MGLSSGRYQLANAFKSLKQEWEGTEEIWRDAVRKDFSDEFWDPLASRLTMVLSAIDRLDLEMAQMRQDCGESA